MSSTSEPTLRKKPGPKPELSRQKQPAYYLIKEQGRSVGVISRVIDVPYLHLRQAVYGMVRPSQEVRDRLPGLLGVPLDQLFEATHLRRLPHDNGRWTR